MCLIGKTQLLCMQCRGVGPHLAARGKSHGFSRVAAGTSCIFTSFGGDGHLKLGFVQRSQDSCLDMSEPREVKLCLAGKYRCFWG